MLQILKLKFDQYKRLFVIGLLIVTITFIGYMKYQIYDLTTTNTALNITVAEQAATIKASQSIIDKMNLKAKENAERNDFEKEITNDINNQKQKGDTPVGPITNSVADQLRSRQKASKSITTTGPVTK